MADDKKNPKEASNIFHSIMKASVKPDTLDFDKVVKAVKSRFDVDLTYEKGKGLIYPKELNSERVIEIQQYVRENF